MQPCHSAPRVAALSAPQGLSDVAGDGSAGVPSQSAATGEGGVGGGGGVPKTTPAGEGGA